MSEKRRSREPRQVVAALEVAQMARNALADGIEQNRENGWDSELLIYELVRTLGTFARFSEVPPSKLEDLIEFLRRVYAGLASGSTPSVEQVLQSLCPESDPQRMSDDTKSEGKPLQ